MRNTIAIAIAVLSLIGLMIYEPHATVQTTEIVTAIPESTDVPVAVLRQAEEPYAVEEAVERTGGTLVGTEVVENVEAVEAPVPDEVSDVSEDFTDEAEEIPSEDTESATEAVEQSGECLGEYLGEWTISFYCNCPICTGQWSGGPTASGVMPTAWHTIACGSLDFGTEVYIDGLGYFTVEDRGVDGAWIDVYLDDHDLCNEYGLQYRDVYIVG